MFPVFVICPVFTIPLEAILEALRVDVFDTEELVVEANKDDILPLEACKVEV